MHVADSSVNTPNQNGRTPLHSAAEGGRTVVRQLLENGADVLALDTDRRTPLHLAAENGHSTAAHVLIDLGTHAIVNKEWRTKLNVTEWNGYKAAVQLLLSYRHPYDLESTGELISRFHRETGIHPRRWDLTIPWDNDGGNVLELLGQPLSHDPRFHRRTWFLGSDFFIRRLLQEADVTFSERPDLRIPLSSEKARLSVWDLVKGMIITPQHIELFTAILGICISLLVKAEIVNAQDESGQTALHLAANNMNLNRDVIKLLIEEGAKVNMTDNDGETALHRAAEHTSMNEDVVWLLINNGAQVNMRDNEGQTALHKAAKAANLLNIEVLLDSHVDVKMQDNEGGTALHQLSGTRQELAVSKLLSRSSTLVNIRDDAGRTALLRAVDAQDDRISREILRDKNAVIEPQDAQTALELAVNNRDDTTMQVLIDNGVFIEGENGQRALQGSVDNGWQKMIETLLNEGVDATTAAGQEALQLAIQNEWQTILQLLLEKRVCVGIESDDVQQILQLAVEKEWVRIVELSLQYVLSVAGESGQHLLQRAEIKNNTRVMRLLLTKADIKTLDESNVLWEAAEHQSRDMVRLLGRSGANINAKHNNTTVLHVLANNNDWEVVEILVREGRCVDINEVDEYGQTVLHLAASDEKWKAVDLLVRNCGQLEKQDSQGKTPLDLMDSGHRTLYLLVD